MQRSFIDSYRISRRTFAAAAAAAAAFGSSLFAAPSRAAEPEKRDVTIAVG